ncbi:FAD-dependent monooxygenase [Streptacidiphilus monticola]
MLTGDAAHTLSPILGQGVNHAVIDAVTLAPMLAPHFAGGRTPSIPLLDSVLAEFQAVREPSVARSRGLQLRQERMFALEQPWQVRGRQLLYRLVDRSPALKQRILAGAYFQLQGGDGVPGLDLTAPAAAPVPAAATSK